MAIINENIEDLHREMQNGNEDAFAKLYQLFAADLISFAAARLYSLDEARDIVHDLFVTLWADREKITINISLRAYLFTAIRYKIISHIRKNSSREKYANSLTSLPDAFDPVETYNAKLLAENIEKLVFELTPRVQEVFRLSRYHHLTTREIAEKLNTSERTVKNQLSSALNYLRTKLGNLSSIFFWI